jgi:hypothetical protein
MRSIVAHRVPGNPNDRARIEPRPGSRPRVPRHSIVERSLPPASGLKAEARKLIADPKSGIQNRKGAKDTKENKKLQCERRSPFG